MRLFVNGSVLPVAQMGPDFVFLKHPPTTHAPTFGEIEIVVDGSPDRFAVWLPKGMSAGDVRVLLAEQD